MTSSFYNLENRLRELERQVSDMRSLRDQLDELELLKADKEKLSKDNSRFVIYTKCV